ncbi:hypothetical protein K7X08_032392 [Anisodus acutangulus]|uniref:Uncharacterized protein n=1 Tax=Anisodus acutangulus TaxID=402998 RepID=A0A9Q1LZS8_9SOLA|nr:hypothetical protein K7X08_032392 [Anisodus acutangulus]
MTSRKKKESRDDVPRSKEGTTTAPEVSELIEVDTLENMVRKIKNEDIALRFAEPESKKLYLLGLEMKSDGNLTRPEVLSLLIETALATFVATSSAPIAGLGVPAHGMRLIRLVEAKVTKLVEKFLAYVKEAIDITLAPHKENLEARIMTQLSALDPPEIVPSGPIQPPAEQLFSTQPRVSIEPHMEEDQIMNDNDDRSERQSESEPDSDGRDDLLASVCSAVRAVGIPPDDVDIVVVMQ